MIFKTLFSARPAVLARTASIAALLAVSALPLALTGCGCGLLSKDAWSGGGNCARQAQVERDVREQQSQRDVQALKKSADGGDVKAQVAMGQFHIFENHANSERATGLAYYDKASHQGDLQARRIFVTELLRDCQAKAFKLGQNRLNGPQYAPHCAAEWLAMETLATQACVRNSQAVNSSIQVALGEAFEDAGKSDDADFWYAVAATHCTTAEERASGRMSGFIARLRTEGGSQQVRGAMWLGVRGRHLFPTLPLGTPDVEQKARARQAILQAKVARSGIRPAL